MQDNEPESQPQENNLAPRVVDLILRIHAGKLKIPLNQQLDYLKTEIGKVQDEKDRIALEIAFGTVKETMDRLSEEKEASRLASDEKATATPRRRRRWVAWSAIVLVILLVAAILLVNRVVPGHPFEVQSSYIGTAPHNKPLAVVFVHGIFGTKEDTWVNNGASFPELLATDPSFAKQIDVFLFEYFTPKFGNAASIVGLADQLRGSLDDNHVFEDHRNVVFLSHSMGGIVVRQFLLTKRDRLAKVPMLYFYAAPTNGSELTEAARAISSNPQLRGMLPLEGNDLLQSIQSGWLGWPQATAVPAYCAYETLLTNGVTVVSQSSATALCNRDLDPISANHIDIVKPKDRSDSRYTRFINAMRMSCSSALGPSHAAARPPPKSSDLPFGPDTCKAGYVFREAVPHDHVCVTKDTHNMVMQQNEQSDVHVSPNGGRFGLGSCLPGYVFREAVPGDHVCVSKQARQQVAKENRNGPSRRLIP